MMTETVKINDDKAKQLNIPKFCMFLKKESGK